MRAWVSKRLDFSFSDWLFAVGASLRPRRGDAASAVENFWSPDGRGMAGLSVRSLFDLYLAAAEWDPGDRIIFTAVTIADMPRIAREHGFEVVSVDVDPRTTAPDMDALRALITPRTRAVVFTHLYGARLEVGEAVALAHEQGVHFVEDCAEAYVGREWTGHAGADLTLFSFGVIKTATALGGGLARVSDAELLARMRALAAAQPLQPVGEYLQKCLKYGLLAAAGAPLVFGLLVRIVNAAGLGHDVLLHRLTRGFAGPEFFRRIRRRPSVPLLRMLGRRLAEGSAPFRRRVGPGERLVAALEGFDVPAADARPHSYWLIPVVVNDPDALVARLGEHGFHGTRGRAFSVVESDGAVRCGEHPGADRLLQNVVFLPFSPEMPEAVLDRLATLVQEEAG